MVDISRIAVNFQPSTDISKGSRISIQLDHEVKKAIVAPTPAPERSRIDANGIVTKVPPGANHPSNEPRNMPFIPVEFPNQFSMKSGEDLD